jgi:hypothetical protein
MFSKMMSSLRPSPIQAMAERTRQAIGAGRSVVDMTLGEPDFPTPPHIAQAAVRAIENGETRYTPINGSACRPGQRQDDSPARKAADPGPPPAKARRRRYESERLADQLQGQPLSDKMHNRVRQSAKMMYVGFSRPTHLLCFALHESRFQKIEAGICANTWDIERL